MSSPIAEPEETIRGLDRGGGGLPSAASEPLVGEATTSAAESVSSAVSDADILSQLEETEAEEALTELQDLLVGRERDDIERLEGAVTGFIGAMINDDHLSSLVGAMVKEAMARQMVLVHEDMGQEASRLVVSAFRRELAIARADMPEMVAPFLGKAVSDAIDRSQDRMRGEVAKSVRGIIARELSVQRGELPEQLRQVVKNTVSAIARQVLTDLHPEAESMVTISVEKEIAVRRGDLPERLAPYVEEAIQEEISVSGNRIVSGLEPVLEEKIAQLVAVGRKRLSGEMAKILLPEIREQLINNQERILPFVQDTIQELVQEGLHSEVGRSMTDYTQVVRKETLAAHRHFQVILGLAVGVLILAGSLYALYSRFDARLQYAQERILKLEGAQEFQQRQREDSAESSPAARRLRASPLP